MIWAIKFLVLPKNKPLLFFPCVFVFNYCGELIFCVKDNISNCENGFCITGPKTFLPPQSYSLFQTVYLTFLQYDLLSPVSDFHYHSDYSCHHGKERWLDSVYSKHWDKKWARFTSWSIETLNWMRGRAFRGSIK